MIQDCDFNNDAMTCPACGFVAGGRDWKKNCAAKRNVVTRVVAEHLPGHQIKRLFSELGIAGCLSCWALALEMDRMGTDWCRSHRDELVDRILANSKKFPWSEKLPAALAMLVKLPSAGGKAGLAAIVAPFSGRSMTEAAVRSAIGALLDEAIAKAERTRAAAPSAAKPSARLAFHAPRG